MLIRSAVVTPSRRLITFGSSVLRGSQVLLLYCQTVIDSTGNDYSQSFM